MAVKKIQFDGRTLIDLTADTVTAARLQRGYTAHNADGNIITGTLDLPSGSVNITANGTYDVSNKASAVVSVPQGATNAYTAVVTLGTHNAGNVPLCTLPDEVYAHKDDDTFTVALTNLTPSSIVQFDDYQIIASNNPNMPKGGSYVVYGVGLRCAGSSVGVYHIYYPPNDTNNQTGLGGLGKFWLNGKVLTYKSGSYFLGAGTLMVVVMW